MLLNAEDVGIIVRHLRQLGVSGGVDDSVIGEIFTQNPHILIHGLVEFKEKTDYFLRKKFSPDQLVAIMTKAPFLFSRSVEEIDARLGFFQRSFAVTGQSWDQVGSLVGVVVGLVETSRLAINLGGSGGMQLRKFLLGSLG